MCLILVYYKKKPSRIDLRFDVKEKITQETFKIMINQTY